MLAAILFGGAVGGVAGVVNPRLYAANGLLLGLGGSEAPVENELAVFRSDELLRGLVAAVGLPNFTTRCFIPAQSLNDCALFNVQSHFKANIVGVTHSQDGSAMLRLTATDPDPQVAVAMVEAAVAQDRTLWQLGWGAEWAPALMPQLSAAETALAGTVQAAAQLRADLHVHNVGDDLSAIVARANQLSRRDGELRVRQAAVAAELASARADFQLAPQTVVESREVSGGDAAPDARSAQLQLKLERAHLLQLYTSDYPGLAEINRKIEIVESAMRAQARATNAVTREIRNPLLTGLAAQIATLGSEGAALAGERQEIRQQTELTSAREAVLRDADSRLAVLQRVEGSEEARVHALSSEMAILRAKDATSAARLAQRRLLQHPEAVLQPWTGTPAALGAGTLASLLFGFTASIMTRRRDRRHPLVSAVRTPAGRLEAPRRIGRPGPALRPGHTDAPRDLAVHPSPDRHFILVPPDASGDAGPPLASRLAAARSMRMFAAGGDGAEVL